MRPVVALTETRPETAVADYRRLLDLAEIVDPGDTAGTVLAAAAHGGGWLAGCGCPPWQLDGMLSRLAAAGSLGQDLLVGAVAGGPGWRRSDLRGWGWTDVLAAHGAQLISPDTGQPARVHPHRILPALAEAMPGGYTVPAALLGRRLVLAAVPVLAPAWGLAGAVALLRDLVLGPMPRLRKIPTSEVTAELVALAAEVCGPLPAVLDAVVWDTSAVAHETDFALRHVLLASNDPVALDAVAVRLAGGDPLRIPWLQLCRERGLGAVAVDEIRLAGKVDLLELDFGFGQAAFSGQPAAGFRLPQRPRGRTRGKGRRDRAALGDSPWGRLFADYQGGKISPSSATERTRP